MTVPERIDPVRLRLRAFERRNLPEAYDALYGSISRALVDSGSIDHIVTLFAGDGRGFSCVRGKETLALSERKEAEGECERR
ncbi:MAG: hypothetical protein JXD23_17705 [Spirochaetales bacterium]|nr:hypothetical protein [Spirochaetales bacterium]